MFVYSNAQDLSTNLLARTIHEYALCPLFLSDAALCGSLFELSRILIEKACSCLLKSAGHAKNGTNRSAITIFGLDESVK
jgi:hypothetical protein